MSGYMPKKEHRWKKRKKTRKVSGKVRESYSRGKTSKHKCAVCKGIVHGTPHGRRQHQVSKISKSKRRPEAVLAGVLCNVCRAQVIEEATKVKYGVKNIGDVSLRLRKYIGQIEKRIE